VLKTLPRIVYADTSHCIRVGHVCVEDSTSNRVDSVLTLNGLTVFILCRFFVDSEWARCVDSRFLVHGVSDTDDTRPHSHDLHVYNATFEKK